MCEASNHTDAMFLTLRLVLQLCEPTKRNALNFRASRASNICQQTFHDNFERCCRSFKVATFFEAKEISHIKNENEMTDSDVQTFSGGSDS